MTAADSKALIVEVPGTKYVLEYEREPNERLLRLSGGGRTYVEAHGSVTVFDGGWVRFSEGPVDRGFLRSVETAEESWAEEYRWDGDGFPVHIDGVDIRRDSAGRVTACRGAGVEWRYGYSGEHLTVVDGPEGARFLTRDGNGRPLRVRMGSRVADVAYDADGARLGIPSVPANWNRDSLGRLWTVTDADGRVLHTYLWDGYACLARIDGAPGAPLAAVFSLDPSRTPVRVITREGTVRVPRDLFGESLLRANGVPGLHGGAIHAGFVYYRARAMDPRCGSYDRPDPFHGGADDPRRSSGFAGPVPVESAATGPYAVCQYDAITYTDPTAENTGLLVLSDFTWSFVHNIAGWFGLDWTINFWLSLFSGRPGEFFEFEGFHSDRTGAYGTRRGGLIADMMGTQARTYHHQIWVQAEGFDELSDGFVFDPGGRFEPTLYGTLLRGVPSKDSFLLQGNMDALPGPFPGPGSNPPWQWGRAGGAAEAVIPGLPVPWFPSGGLHFNNPLRSVRGLQKCDLTELVPAAMPPVTATIAQATLFIDVSSMPAGLAANDEVLLSDAAGLADIKTVLAVTPQGSGARIRFTDSQQTVSGSGLRLRGLSAPSAAETLNAGGPANGLLTNGTALPYAASDPLRLTQNNAVLGAALINRIETRLNIDGAVPATIQAPVDVTPATQTGSPASVTLTGNALTGAPLPAPGDFISLTGNGITIGALVGGTAAAPTVDRDAAALTPLGSSVDWRPLTPSSSLGTAAALDAGNTITYSANAPRTAPAGGFLILSGAPGSANTARLVQSVVYDALVLGSALPGAAATPFQVERFTFEPPDLTGLTTATLQGLAVPNGVTLPGVALQLNVLNAPALAAVTNLASATLAGAVATYAAPLALGSAPVPSQLVVLTDGASNVEAAVVFSIAVQVQFDRNIPAQLPDLRMAALGPGGPVYTSVVNADGTLTATPSVGGTAVEMPRFGVGEVVEVTGGGLAAATLYAVTAVAGCTLTLSGPSPLTAGAATVQRMIPVSAPGPAALPSSPADAPANGTPWAGIRGTPVAGTPTDVTFTVWRPDDVSRITRACLVSRDPANPATAPVVTPVQVVSTVSATITFTAAPSKVAGAITIATPNATPFYAASFSQSGVDLTISGVLPQALAPGTNPIIAVPYGPAATPVTATGTLGPGTVLCPDDPVNYEFDRRHSLAEHELTHSLQPARTGQLYWGIWPLFAYELVMELTTDVELPKFSAYVQGKIEKVNATRVLRIPEPAGIEFKTGTLVQVANDSQSADLVTLGAAATEGGGFVIDSNFSIRDGDVQLRRQVDSGAGTVVLRDAFYNTFRLTSLGGLMNVSGAAIYGGLVYGIGSIIQGFRKLFGSSETYPGTVDSDGLTVHLTSDAGKLAIQGANRITLRSGDNSVTRELDSIAGDTVKLKQTTDLRDAVQWSVKENVGDFWDWHTYYPASVPDAAQPARIKLQARSGGDTLTLKQFDRVTVGAGTSYFRTNVTATTADGLVDLEDAPPASARSEFRIALVDSNDPIKGIDDRILTEMGPGKVKLGWLRYVYDPFEQINFRTHPEKNSFWDIVARVARYGWGTHTWSWLAVPGLLFFKNLFIQAQTNSLKEAQGHLSPYEQEASSNSGNLYSPLGRIFGGFSEAGFGAYNATAGDVARYWHTLFQGITITAANQYSPSSSINAVNRDGPGGSLQSLLRIIPNFTGAPGAPEPNGTVAPSNPAVAGSFVPDLLVQKSQGAPTSTPGSGPTGFVPSDLGLIPTTPRLNQSIGCYLAFTQPGTHRVTIQDTTSFSAQVGRQGREAQAGQTQPLWFDITVADVTLTIAGQPVAATPPAPVSLVVLQQASVSVTPTDGGRQYALTVPLPGAVVTPGANVLSAAAAPGNDVVEVTRVYTFTLGATPGSGSFDAPVLNEHGGMHLPATFHIPVRTFPVTVVNIVPMLDQPEPPPTSNVVNSRLPAQHGFLLVPVNVTSGLTLTFSYPNPTPAGIVDPNLGIPAQPDPSATARQFLGPDGHVFDFTFSDPPEEPAQLTIKMTVSAGGANADITCGPIDYTPHFRLLDAANAYTVQRGGTLDLTAEGNVAVGTVTVTAGLTATVAGSTITIQCDAAAPLGPHTVLCADSADATRQSRRTIVVIA